MHITLINPAWLFRNAGDIVLSNNLGLGYLAGYVREKGGHTVQIIDALAAGIHQRRRLPSGELRVGLTDEQVVDEIKTATDIIGISVPFSHLICPVERLAQSIKKHFPGCPIVYGGVHPSTSPDEFEQSHADFWLRGEGEKAFSLLVEGHDPAGIPGLRSKSHAVMNPPEASSVIMNLDEIPFPARDLLPMRQYAQFSPRRIRHKPSASIITSRGCPWDCQFCSIHPVYGYRWRKRSAENVLAEIRELIQHYQIRQIEFEDDNLTLDRERAQALFGGIQKIRRDHRIELTWGTPNGIRAETVDRDLLRQMKESGCVRVTFALEHGDEEVRALMNKKLNREKFEQAVREAVECGLRVEIFNMVGYPGETEDRFRSALRYYRTLSSWGVDTFHFFYPQPYPGTRLYEYCQRNHYLIDRSSGYSLLPEIKIETEDFDSRDVVRRRKILLNHFDSTYRLRQKIKAVLPERFIDLLNRYLPRKSM